MRYGIRSVTMDQISRELGISKKTLYQYFTDKNDLVSTTIKLHLEENRKYIKGICQKQANAIQQILDIGTLMINIHNEIGHGVLFDLKKYHPEAFEILSNHKVSEIYNNILENLKLGIKQKLYRPDIDINVISGFYMSSIFTCMDSEVPALNQCKFTELYVAFLDYHFHGICTSEGINYFLTNKNQLLNSNSVYEI